MTRGNLIFAGVAAVSLALGGCAQQLQGGVAAIGQVNDALIGDATAISNALQPDLQQASIAAGTINPLTAQPYDANVKNCIDNGVFKVKASIDTLLGAAKGGGLATTALVASVLRPGSVNYDAAKATLISACAAAGLQHGVDAINGLGKLVPALAVLGAPAGV